MPCYHDFRSEGQGFAEAPKESQGRSRSTARGTASRHIAPMSTQHPSACAVHHWPNGEKPPSYTSRYNMVGGTHNGIASHASPCSSGLLTRTTRSVNSSAEFRSAVSAAAATLQDYPSPSSHRSQLSLPYHSFPRLHYCEESPHSSLLPPFTFARIAYAAPLE